MHSLMMCSLVAEPELMRYEEEEEQEAGISTVGMKQVTGDTANMPVVRMTASRGNTWRMTPCSCAHVLLRRRRELSPAVDRGDWRRANS